MQRRDRQAHRDALTVFPHAHRFETSLRTPKQRGLQMVLELVVQFRWRDGIPLADRFSGRPSEQAFGGREK